jgi:methylmalonyl-CoA mutase
LHFVTHGTMQQPSDEKLFSDFPETSRQEWEKKILEDLKGADYEKKLVWHTREGFDVRPYYCADDLQHLKYLEGMPGEFPYVRTGKTALNEWEIRQDLTADKPEIANKTALDILQKGVTSPGFIFDGKVIDSGKKFSVLLAGIQFDCITLNLLTGKDSPRIMEYLVEEAKERKYNLKALKGSFNFDPIGNLTVSGNFYQDADNDFHALKKLIERASDMLPIYKVLEVNGLNFSNAGATVVQELAFALSIGNEYLSKLTDIGLKTDDIAGRMQFVFGIGSGYFMEIAKLRAARLLWAKIVEAYQPGNKECSGMFIHAVTTQWNRTLYDPHVNMLRSATESMSAILGGVDSLEIKPFDSAYAPPSAFSLRNARNIQIILKEEAYFDKVVDPAAGSYYLENLTHNIAERAWGLFLETEDKGGYTEAFKTGFIQEIIAKTASQRLHDIDTEQEVLVGTNQYENNNEQIDAKIASSLETGSRQEEGYARPIRLFRGAVEFEKQRIKKGV